MTGAWPRLAPAPPGVRSRVTYTAPCPHGYASEWIADRVPAHGDSGDGVRVHCLCRCTRCLLAVAVAPC